MKKFVANIDRDELEYFVGILTNSGFNHMSKRIGNRVLLKIAASSKDSIPGSIRCEFVEMSQGRRV